MRVYFALLILLVLVSPLVLGLSATKKDDFTFGWVNTTKNKIRANVENGKAPVYALYVEVVNLPSCVSLKDNKTKFIDFLEQNKEEKIWWTINSSDSCNLNLTKDNFKVVSWDNSVSLQGLMVNNLPVKNNSFLKTETPEVMIEGFTDSATFCKEMQKETKNKSTFWFWTKKEHCNTKVRINDQPWFYADDEGYFVSNKLKLEEGNNTFTVTVKDPGLNTNSVTFTIEYAPPLSEVVKKKIVDNIHYIIGALIVIFVIGWLISKSLARRREALKRKREFEDMKKRRIELRRKLNELIKKAPLVGLTQEEAIMKKNYEQELLALQEELLERPEFQRELEHIAEKTVQWAKEGVTSKEIKQRLVDMGYTQKEISIIQKKFKEKLGKD